jgi:heme/copper-type cytochrome/quinol oxidase subunit 1
MSLKNWYLQIFYYVRNLQGVDKLVSAFKYVYLFIFFERKYFTKKWLYTINHKKLGLLYFFYTLVTAIMGSYLATCIRLEMAYPGSPFFNGDSLKYLQVITAHALIMIFFVVVPIFFGGFANYFLPYHVGSKDVAYPRLNNLGFWIQPCGFLLIAKMGSMRLEYWTTEVKTVFFSSLTKVDHFLQHFSYEELFGGVGKQFADNDYTKLRNMIEEALCDLDKKAYDVVTYRELRAKIIDELELHRVTRYDVTLPESNDYSYKLIFWKDFYNSTTTFWSLAKNAIKQKRQKRFLVKCISANQTVAGWTFITPFSSNIEYTGFGLQDMIILGVYYAGISTTISIVNLLVTRRTLAMPGLRSRRILLPFITITSLLMLRALSIITPILGSAMLMLLTDRHWKTSFFDFSYGGDPIFFQHLFWFFGHPEVYVLIIPAFGIINSVLPTTSTRRVASKHHLIWAIYIMNYMGFLVWGHHMYLVGLDHRSRSLYSTITIMISMPATIKIVNWTYTLVNGMIRNNLILYGIISFVFFFLVAGMTGMWLSHVSLNISMHDSLYVIAHFHLMLSGAVVLGIFVGFYYYYFSLLQLKYSKLYSFAHIVYYTLGQWGTFIPMFWVAFSGLPRRLHDFPLMYLGWQSMSTVGHFTTMLGVFFFYTTLFESTLEKKVNILVYNIVPRLYSVMAFIKLKDVNNIAEYAKMANFPVKRVRKLINQQNITTM